MSPDIIADVLSAVWQANSTRCASSLDGRVMKLIEELGEVAQAFLSVTSLANAKRKSWSDVREEAADVLIIAADIALTPLDADEDAAQPRLHRYVCDNLHRINMGFHNILKRLSRLNASFGDVCHDDAASAHQYAAELVRYAFALNDLVKDTNQPDQLLAEVQRKIKKWKRRQ
jgi:NTP pyrophosphatase (non-canonical NTP hydrolase)